MYIYIYILTERGRLLILSSIFFMQFDLTADIL